MSTGLPACRESQACRRSNCLRAHLVFSPTQAKRVAAEEEKRKAGEAKAVREAAKKLVKKERQRLRAINEGGGEEGREEGHFYLFRTVNEACTPSLTLISARTHPHSHPCLSLQVVPTGCLTMTT